MERATRSQVAARAGVSKTTVSYVLNGRTDVGIPEITRARVLRAAEELGYVPNRAAQSLRTGQSNMVALWMTVLCPIYYAQVVESVQLRLRESGYEMMVTDTASHQDPRAHLERLAQWPVDGILAFDSSYYVREFVTRYRSLGVPIVSMGVEVCPLVDTVRVDLYPGAAEAMEHLIATGRRVAFLADRAGFAADDARLQAYQRAVRHAGQAPLYVSVPYRSRASSHEAVTRYVAENGAPEALFCYNDDLAIGAHRALLDLGLRMPEDVAIVGHDGTDDTRYLEPRLSTVEVPTGPMCELGWRFLKARIDSPDLATQTATLETTLRTERSSDALRDLAPIFS